MKIWFANARLSKICNSESKLRGKYGPGNAKRIARRLFDLQGVSNLAEAMLLPGRPHELTGDRSGCFAMDLVHPDRIVFRALPERCSDLMQVTEIEIVGIGDYHNG